MNEFELAKLRIEQGHRVRFFQDFYGRQWVKVHGGLWFWRSGRIYLCNEEVVALKRMIALRRSTGASVPAAGSPTADAA